MHVKKSLLLAGLRVLAIIGWIFVCIIVYGLMRLFRMKNYMSVVHNFHRGLCRIIGIRVSVSGQQAEKSPILYVSNHISYLDIFAMGFIRAYYIAKSEVASWPVFGQLARFQNTLFVERKAGRAMTQLAVMKNHLIAGKNLTLYAEGTSTNGAEVKPFKSSLFEAANLSSEGVRVAIQPITMVYTHYAGKPMDQKVRDNYAWYARMPFGSHFLSVLSITKKVDAKIHFHPVCYIDDFDTRKECANHCQKLVAEQLAIFLEQALQQA